MKEFGFDESGEKLSALREDMKMQMNFSASTELDNACEGCEVYLKEDMEKIREAESYITKVKDSISLLYSAIDGNPSEKVKVLKR